MEWKGLHAGCAQYPNERNLMMSQFGVIPPSSATQPVNRILVADDEPAIRSICRLILEPEGMICDEARDGTEAVEVVASRPYDLVILDVDMPGMKGTEVCRRLRSMPTSPRMKILLVSGHAGDGEMAPMLLAGPMIISPSRSRGCSSDRGSSRRSGSRRPRRTPTSLIIG